MLKMHFNFSLSAIKKIKISGIEYRNFAQSFALVLSVAKKVFSARCRLLRKVLNFVFLRRKMYDGTSTEQKTKNAKNAVSLILTAFFNPSVNTPCCHLPL